MKTLLFCATLLFSGVAWSADDTPAETRDHALLVAANTQLGIMRGTANGSLRDQALTRNQDKLAALRKKWAFTDDELNAMVAKRKSETDKPARVKTDEEKALDELQRDEARGRAKALDATQKPRTGPSYDK